MENDINHFSDEFEVILEGPVPAYRVSLWSHIGVKSAINEDYVAFLSSEKAQRATRGSMLIVADGVGSAKGGRVASEVFVRQFLSGYYEAPNSLTVEAALGRSLASVNEWLNYYGRNSSDLENMAAVFCAVIIRGWECYVVSAGDVRCYLVRGNTIEMITTDHLINVGTGGFIARAAGLDVTLNAEIIKLNIDDDDKLFIMSDGCYRYVTPETIKLLTAELAEGRNIVEKVGLLAQHNGSKDDISAALIDFQNLPKKTLTYFESASRTLPMGRVPTVGIVVDGYFIDRKLYEGHFSVLFLARDGGSDSVSYVVLKFPKVRALEDENLRRSFAKEDWVLSAVSSPWLSKSANDDRRRSQLYLVTPFYHGKTLKESLSSSDMSFSAGLDIAQKMAKGLYELHRLGIIHRDIKPDNVILLEDGGLKIIDYGFAYVAGLLDPAPDEPPGTPLYMAPELVNGVPGDSRSDVYAFGITLYMMFSRGKTPTGIHGYRRLRTINPNYPVWIDRIIEKMVRADAAERYSDTLEVLYDLDKYAALAEWPVDSETGVRIRVREVVLLRWLVVALVFVLLFMQSK
ncbi:protein kinase [Acidithiobacillus ferrooxidans]|uniref:protein kinase domain-containing protein n=1 Tax=Acidithiobacillus ferrooxidans TaxID=920 RepID=UPI000A5DB9F8|nr:protein kinase [Acidithiobacillus ferrooxidans]MCR2831604.1 protein kinase [Acidithiobacillus ferrooxidans]